MSHTVTRNGVSIIFNSDFSGEAELVLGNGYRVSFSAGVFAALVEREREACAEIALEHAKAFGATAPTWEGGYESAAQVIADEIRERGGA